MRGRYIQQKRTIDKIWDAVLQFILILSGVLAALFLNNIQTKNKSELSESQMLQELQTSLREDAYELNELRKAHQQSLNACSLIWANLRTHNTWHDSLTQYVIQSGNQFVFIPQTAAFESYKTAGVHLIKNNSIRIALFRLYEESFASVKLMDEEYKQHIYQYWLPFFIENFKSEDSLYQFEPYNPETIVHASDIFIQMRILQIRHQNSIVLIAAAALDANFLVRQIEFELQRMQKKKHTDMDMRTVEFELNGYANAKQVILTGTFNRWHETQHAMQRTETGWKLKIALTPGVYMYKFLVDGIWVEDPDNADKMQNQFETFNSVKEVW